MERKFKVRSDHWRDEMLEAGVGIEPPWTAWQAAALLY